MPKGKRSGGDYDGWILRLIDKVEDIDFSYDRVSWLKFAAQKIQNYHGTGLTERQIAVLDERRDSVFMMPFDLGYSVKEYQKLSGTIKTRYRDLEGRWGKKGTWVSRDKVNQALQEELTSRNIRRGKK